MKSALFNSVLIVVLLFIVAIGNKVHGQETARYGRFQYRKYHWQQYRAKSFKVYFPADAADSLLKFVLKEMPVAMARVKRAMIRDVPKDVNVILYPSIDQFYESNIGSYEQDKYAMPVFNTKGKRVVLAYNGSYEDLAQQLREGLARAVWVAQTNNETSGLSDALAGSAIADKEKVPMWFREGAIRFFAHGWTIEAEDKLRRSFEDNHFSSWQDVLAFQPRLGGHAFCYFLSRKYYAQAPAQTLFQIKTKGTLVRAIRLVVKQPLDTIMQQCFRYYSQRFPVHDADTTEGIQFSIPHKKGIASSFLYSPSKAHIAYVTLNNGKRRLYVYDIGQRTTKHITTYKLAPWIDNHTADQYPLLSWDIAGENLFVTMPHKGRVVIDRYTPAGGRKGRDVLYGVDGVLDLAPVSENKFLLTAFRKAQGDVVGYNARKERYTPYTDDEYDDMQGIRALGDSDVLFVSERPRRYTERRTYLIEVGYKKDTLWQGLYRKVRDTMEPVVVDTVSYIKWRRPVMLDGDRVLVTNTVYGEERNAIVQLPNGDVTQLGTYRPFQLLPGAREIVSFKATKDSILVSEQKVNNWVVHQASARQDMIVPWMTDHMDIERVRIKEDSLMNNAKDTTHYFMEDVLKVAYGEDTVSSGKRRRNKRKKESSAIGPYQLQLHKAFFNAQINNDYFINRHQPYKNYKGQFKFPEVAGMTKAGMTDLFEDHHFTVAYALPAATSGSTFFVRYENASKQYDIGGSYFRKVDALKPDAGSDWVDENGNKYPQNAKVKTHYYELFAKRPLTYFSYLKLQAAVRYDRTIFLATDRYSLTFPPLPGMWSINTLSYQVNKLRPTLPLLYKGFRANSSLDILNSVSKEKASIAAIAVNAEYHRPIYKYITVVMRAHAGLSGGDKMMLYNMGGVDNNITPKTDTTVKFGQDLPYAFQTLIAPLRGYAQNSTYGDRFMLANVDVYFPVFQTLIPFKTALPFVNNIQLGVLADVANAKQTTVLSNVNSGKWLWSYGLSIRSILAGYPLRFEIAWPGSFEKKPVWYLSLNVL